MLHAPIEKNKPKPKKDNMPRNYTHGERALILIGILANQSNEEINTLLKKDQLRSGASQRTIPVSSQNIIKDRYIPRFLTPKKESGTQPTIKNKVENLYGLMWQHIVQPKTIGQLKNNNIEKENELIDTILSENSTKEQKIDAIYDVIELHKLL